MENMAMQTIFDITPLFRSSIGFDRILDLLDGTGHNEADNWPPYDVVKTSEDAYRIAMAVAGFSRDDLKVTSEPNLLVIEGAKAGESEAQYLYRGIAGRAFECRFQLADYVEVASADLDNGLLTVDLVRKLPEEKKPRRIEVQTGAALPKRAALEIEGDKQAA